MADTRCKCGHQAGDHFPDFNTFKTIPCKLCPCQIYIHIDEKETPDE